MVPAAARIAATARRESPSVRTSNPAFQAPGFGAAAVVSVQFEMPADRVFFRPELAGRRFADHGKIHALVGFEAREMPPADNRDSEQIEIRVRRVTDERPPALVADHHRQSPGTQKRHGPMRDVPDLRQILKAVHQPLLQCRHLRRIGAEIAIDRVNALCFVPRLRDLRATESAHQQTCADQKHHRYRDLRGDQ
jgi:hypothetical protein